MLTRDLDIHLLCKNGSRRLFTLRRWMLAVPIACVMASAGLNLALWKYRDRTELMAKRAAETEGLLAEQKAASLRLDERLARAGAEVARIRSFNEKLGVMVDFEPSRDPALPAAGAPASAISFSAGGGPWDVLQTRRMNALLDYLTSEVSLQEILQQQLRNSLSDKKLQFEARPSLWPLRGEISSDFGGRRSPFGRRGDFHKGVDIRVPHGTLVHAPGAGRVKEVGYMGGYGLRVVIEHDYGIETVFAHLRKALVVEGQQVRRGQRIALSGNSGRSTGPHLHYEVHLNNTPVDPERFMLD